VFYTPWSGTHVWKSPLPNIHTHPPPAAPCPAEEERRVVSLPYDSLVVRLNSVQHLLDSLAGLERMVVDRRVCECVEGGALVWSGNR
jgi:hypothetical protein